MRRLICAFVVRNGINRFSHDVAHIIFWHQKQHKKVAKMRPSHVPVSLFPEITALFPCSHQSKSWFLMFPVLQNCLYFSVPLIYRLCSPEINALVPQNPREGLKNIPIYCGKIDNAIANLSNAPTILDSWWCQIDDVNLICTCAKTGRKAFPIIVFRATSYKPRHEKTCLRGFRPG